MLLVIVRRELTSMERPRASTQPSRRSLLLRWSTVALLGACSEAFVAPNPWSGGRSLATHAHIPKAGDGSPDLRDYFHALTNGQSGGGQMTIMSAEGTETGSMSDGGGAGETSIVNLDADRSLPPPPLKEVKDLKVELLKLASQSDRGRLLDSAGRYRAASLLQDLEMQNPTADPAESPLLQGRWTLVYSTDDPTRSSPFFWAFRKALAGVKDPRDSRRGLSEAIFSVTDSLPFKGVGTACQTIRGTTLKSEVVITLGGSRSATGLAFFPHAKSVMTTTSALQAVDGRRLELTVQDTRVCGSTAQALLPSLLPLDQWAFPVAQVFDAVSPYANTVRVTLTYLDEEMRVVRDEDGRPFVYVRAD